MLCASPLIPFPCRSRWVLGQCDSWMETRTIIPSTRNAQRWSLDDLSSELLALVFKQLRDIDKVSLGSVYQISRRFSAIVAPIKYETVLLNESIISPEAETQFPLALEKIYNYTRHVEARSNLDPEHTKHILDRIQRLHTIRWHYVRSDFCSGRFWVLSDILRPGYVQPNNTRLFVENLPLLDFAGELNDTYLKAIPIGILVSLKMASPTPPLTTRLHSLKQLLLEARRLETFHFEDRGQGTRFAFVAGERLPPFKELALRSYDWNHSPEVVERHWDFSRMRRLKLVDVPMFEFLASVPLVYLTQLETLHCEDFSAHVPDRRREATKYLYVLIRQIRALQTLYVTCETEIFPLDALLQHGRSINALHFRHYIGFGDENRRCPTMHAEDIDRLSRELINLKTLELDYDSATLSDPITFLKCLCAFPSLHTLTLHTQTVIDAEDDNVPPNGSFDYDYEAAVRIFSVLIQGKQLLQQKQAGSGIASWRSITLIVGGWRRVMVRRMSEDWREMNRRGIFAERCFVLERSDDGAMVVREERALENQGPMVRL